MENLDRTAVKDAYQKSKKRLLFLDYEGTLAPTFLPGQNAFPSDALNELLFSLTSDPLNTVVILSGQPREILADSFTSLPLTLVAENGGFLRQSRDEWKTLFTASVKWQETAHQALQALRLRYEGTSVERKHFSLVWRYETIASTIPDVELKQMQTALRSLAKINYLIVHDDEKAMEFFTPGINKGSFAASWMRTQGRFDFILAIGDNKSDEVLFDAIGKDYFTIKVGQSTNSVARYCLDKQESVLPFLSNLLIDDAKSNDNPT